MSVVSPIEASLLARDQDIRPYRQAYVAELDRELSREDLVALMRAQLSQTPRLRQIVTGWPAPFWADDAGFELSGHVRETTLPVGQSIESWIGHRLAMASDRTHPLWQAWLVRLTDGPAVLVAFAHPAVLAAPGAGQSPGAQLATGVAGMIDTALRTLGAKKAEYQVAGVAIDLDDVAAVARDFACAVDDVTLAVIASGLRRWWVTRDEDPVALVQLGGRGGLVALPVQVDPLAQLAQLASMTATWAGAPEDSGAVCAALARAAQTVVGAPPHAVFIAGSGPTPGEFRLGDLRVRGATVFTTPTDDEEVAVTATNDGGRILLGATATTPLAGFGRGVRDGLATLVAATRRGRS